MKPKKFMPGQAVTPSRNLPWNTIIGAPGPCPIFGKVYHVSEHDYLGVVGRWFVSLTELSDKDAFDEENFDPVITTHELESELSEIEITVAI